MIIMIIKAGHVGVDDIPAVVPVKGGPCDRFLEGVNPGWLRLHDSHFLSVIHQDRRKKNIPPHPPYKKILLFLKGIPYTSIPILNKKLAIKNPAKTFHGIPTFEFYTHIVFDPQPQPSCRGRGPCSNPAIVNSPDVPTELKPGMS